MSTTVKSVLVALGAAAVVGALTLFFGGGAAASDPPCPDAWPEETGWHDGWYIVMGEDNNGYGHGRAYPADERYEIGYRPDEECVHLFRLPTPTPTPTPTPVPTATPRPTPTPSPDQALGDSLADPVQQGATVVYLIDDTGSQINLRIQLNLLFARLLNDHGTTPNVRVAALVHGSSPENHTLRPEERKTLGRGPAGPHMFGSGFKAPRDISRVAISNAVNSLTLNRGNEYLYPAIDLGREMIESECPATVNLSQKPWCESKVIVVLGDGRPGKAADDYFADASERDGVDDELPEKLLARVKAAGIKVNTICLGAACVHELIRVDGARYYYDLPTCQGIQDKCIGYSGADLMQKLAELTGGKYHGIRGRTAAPDSSAAIPHAAPPMARSPRLQRR